MRCPICKQGETRPGKTTVTLHQAETVLMVRHVPAEVCQNCGEVYLSEEVAQLTYPQFLASRRRASSKAVRACEDVSCNRPIIFRPMKNRPQAPG